LSRSDNEPNTNVTKCTLIFVKRACVFQTPNHSTRFNYEVSSGWPPANTNHSWAGRPLCGLDDSKHHREPYDESPPATSGPTARQQLLGRPPNYSELTGKDLVIRHAFGRPPSKITLRGRPPDPRGGTGLTSTPLGRVVSSSGSYRATRQGR